MDNPELTACLTTGLQASKALTQREKREKREKGEK
jgi:hypothetical protein